MAAHALLSASGSKRWMTCLPSARLESTLPEQPRKKGAFNFSEEGTTAHNLADAKLKRHYNQITGKEYLALVNEVKETPYYNEEFEAYVDNYVVYVRSQIGEGDTPYFEQRVDFSEWVPEGFGTADVVIMSHDKVRVIDLKFGKGVPVSADDNPQLRLYALGAWYKYKELYPNVGIVEYTIHQPRLESITTEATTLEKLVDWADFVVKPKAKKAWTGQGEFVPGDHCQFCRAKSQCRARNDFADLSATMDFKAPPLLTEAELVTVLQRSSDTKKWIKDVEEFLLTRATNSGEIPEGYQVGKTDTKRKIVDTDKATMLLLLKGHKDIFEPQSLKSVAQLEKLVGKGQLGEVLGELIIKPEGEPKLVPVVAVNEFA